MNSFWVILNDFQMAARYQLSFTGTGGELIPLAPVTPRPRRMVDDSQDRLELMPGARSCCARIPQSRHGPCQTIYRHLAIPLASPSEKKFACWVPDGPTALTNPGQKDGNFMRRNAQVCRRLFDRDGGRQVSQIQKNVQCPVA
jgi:hypothetical protein